MKSRLNIMKKLNNYTKAEIIDGLCHQMGAGYIIDGIVAYVDEKRIKDLFEADEAAGKAEAAAHTEYSEWLEEVVRKYGSEKRVNISDLPLEELKRGAAFEEKIKKSAAKRQNINRKLEKMIGV